jgi:lysophospholipase L1-like esterase
MPFDLEFEYILGLLAWTAGGATAIVQFLRLRRRWGKTAPHRVKWANAGLSLWMLLASLTVVELYFAIVYDESDSYNMSLVSQHWFRRHVATNEVGFRDSRPFTQRVPEGKRRICFVGDSFTFGHGIKNVADRFSDRIGARLEAARPGRFLVSNISETGINAMQVAKVARYFAEHGYRLDVVVYVVCLNDIEGNSPADDADYYDRLALQSPRFFLFRHSYFLNMLYFRIQQASLPQVRNYYAELAESYQSAHWNGMHDKLDELHEFCTDRNIDLRIAIFPFLHNLGPEYPFDAAHKRIADYCRETGLPCLDLKPTMLPHVREGLTVNHFDAHPNERAHALAAEAMERELLADLFNRQP